MLSKKQTSLIRSLQHKKYRVLNQLFIIEGNKIISDLLKQKLLSEENLRLLIATGNWLDEHSILTNGLESYINRTEQEEINKLSSLVTPAEVMAVVSFEIPEFEPSFIKENLFLAFEAVRDPGNLGTIIRTADWFGIDHIFCSSDSVDVWNSKVVQASMGAVMRVNVHYMELEELFEMASRYKVPVYGTTMDGEDFYETPVKIPGIILFGNEASGLSTSYYDQLKEKLRIPDFPAGSSGTESLNLAISTAIVCSELRRRDRAFKAYSK